MKRALKFLALTLVLSLILAFPYLSCAEEKKEKEKEAQEEKPFVFTNDDLERFATKEEKQQEEGEEEEATYETVAEIIKKINEPQEIRKWKEAKLLEKEGRVKDAEMRLDYLKKKRAAIQNPFLPRPEVSEEDLQAEAGMDNAKRLERTGKQIEDAEENVRRMEAEIEKFKQELRDAGI